VDSANPLEPDGVECNLQAALASLENDRPAAIQQVEAFINQVEALPGTKWTNAEAEELVTKPEEIIAPIEALLYSLRGPPNAKPRAFARGSLQL